MCASSEEISVPFASGFTGPEKSVLPRKEVIIHALVFTYVTGQGDKHDAGQTWPEFSFVFWPIYLTEWCSGSEAAVIRPVSCAWCTKHQRLLCGCLCNWYEWKVDVDASCTKLYQQSVLGSILCAANITDYVNSEKPLQMGKWAFLRTMFRSDIFHLAVQLGANEWSWLMFPCCWLKCTQSWWTTSTK